MELRQRALEGLVKKETMFGDYYRGKRVLVTGHTGFKGSWLSVWLKELGAEVYGLALEPESRPNLHEIIPAGTFAREYVIDIRDAAAVRASIAECRPEFTFHLAAQALVRKSYEEPVATVAVNVLGTLHVLEAMRHECPSAHTLVVTSDKCYENVGWMHGYRETDPMGGHDPYSMSKGACELAVSSWRRSFFRGAGRVVSARAGNVIGGGDYCTDRIVPDCMRALAAGQNIGVRNPQATRPWQHVLDCLSGYLWLGARVGQAPEWSDWAFNFGPSSASNRSVRDLVTEVFKHWQGAWEDLSDPNAVHEASRLHLSTDKAAFALNWQPTWEFAEAVRETVLWYKARHAGADCAATTLNQIRGYCATARADNQAWAVSGS